MFNSLIRPRYPKAAIGFGDSTITALALRATGSGRYSVKQGATLALPEGLITPGFAETNIARPYELEAVLDRLTKECGLGAQRQWSVSLPSNSARTAILSLSEVPASRRELEEVLDFKAETSFGVPSDDLRISMEKLSTVGDGKTRYFASAVRLEVIDEYESVFEAMGWRAGLVLPRAVCELQWLASGQRSGDALLISSQQNGFTAMILRGGQPALVRSVACDSDEMDDEIYRLLVYYNDKYGETESPGELARFLVIGDKDIDLRLKGISAEALGASIKILGPLDLGLELGGGDLRFADVAAPAGAASFAWQ